MTIHDPKRRGLWLAAMLALTAVTSCSNPTANEQKTDGEWIREALTDNNDAAIAFSTVWLTNQIGTSDFTRTIDSVHRGFENRRFFTDSVETQSEKQAFEANVYDTVWGTLSYQVAGKPFSYRFSKLLYAGKAMFLRLGGTGSDPNPWALWKMEQRFGSQPGFGAPILEVANITAAGNTHPLLPRKMVRLFRDSVLTVPADELVDVTVLIRTVTADDSFFVTYPRDGVYFTEAMAHDSVHHTATVQIRSSQRFDVLGVQGFKRKPFYTEGVSGATLSSLQTALIRFYRPPTAAASAP